MPDRLFMLCTGQAIAVDALPKHPGSHIIGELLRILDEGVSVTALALYEKSLPVNCPPATLPAVRMQIIGDARHIKCTCCRHQSRWEIGKAAVKLMLKKYLPE